MSCLHPLKGYAANPDLNDGKRGFTRNSKTGYADRTMTIKCGQCVACRLERARDWSIRCYHEAQMHEENSFLTLTYSDDHLPAPPSVSKKEVQDFLLRLKNALGTRTRYYACGEYGENLHRPHYHLLLFGRDFPDKRFFKRSKTGAIIWTSKRLDEIWSKGHAWIGSVSQASAGYTARYIMKKQTGEAAPDHYRWLGPDGQYYPLEPEFNLMSRGGRGSKHGGLGESWYAKYGDTDCHNHDKIIGANGREYPVPRFYDKLLERKDPKRLKRIKKARAERALIFAEHTTSRRLYDREIVLKSKLSRLTRELEK